jgi:hypothetical protein
MISMAYLLVMEGARRGRVRRLITAPGLTGLLRSLIRLDRPGPRWCPVQANGLLCDAAMRRLPSAVPDGVVTIHFRRI